MGLKAASKDVQVPRRKISENFTNKAKLGARDKAKREDLLYENLTKQS